MEIIVNGQPVEVESKDEVIVRQIPCDICGHHTTITIDRDGKEIFKWESR